MNKQQKEYAAAKAAVKMLEERQEAAEQKYIAEKGIINPDGTVPFALFCIDDQGVFEKANLEFVEMPKNQKNFSELVQARESLKTAEDALIEYGLSVIPERMKSVKESLQNSYKKNYTVRLSLIDLAFRLDTGTVEKCIF